MAKTSKTETLPARARKSPSRRASKRPESTKQVSPAIRPTSPDAKAAGPAEPPEFTIELFDFEKNWRLVKPHLKDPAVEKLLTEGMTVYVPGRELMWLHISKDPKKCNLDVKYDPQLGPAHFDSTDSMARHIGEVVDKAMHKAVERGDFKWNYSKKHTAKDWNRYHTYAKRFEPPIKGTYRFYRIHGACHFTVSWQQALGQRIFPQYTWKIMFGLAHAIAYATDDIGNIKVIFDIYNFNTMSAIELIAFASQKEEGPPKIQLGSSKPFAFVQNTVKRY